MILIVLFGDPIFGQEDLRPDAADANRSIFIPQVHSYSGSPLLLEIEIPDPESLVTEVVVQTIAASLTYEIPRDPDRDKVALVLSPFMKPGTYDLRIGVTTDTLEPPDPADPIRVGFVDFVWGSDNLRFGNNAEYKSLIGTFGEILVSWVEERFGGVSEAEAVVLIDYMYQYFGAESGRCYAFAGTELRLWKWPELLPAYFDEAYDLRPASTIVQRDMNFLQLDIAFDQFLVHGRDTEMMAALGGDSHVPMSREAALAQTDRIIASIEQGEPVMVGFAGPDYHHAMLVYGFIDNPAAQVTDILVANNWKTGENVNLRSKDAEYVRLFRAPDRDGPVMEWWYSDGKRNGKIDHLFAIDVQQGYEHDRVYLDRLISLSLERLRESNRGLILVENVRSAVLSPAGPAAGEDADEVSRDKVSRTYRFEYPAEGAYDLTIRDDGGARILHFVPGESGSDDRAWIITAAQPETGTTVNRFATVGPTGVSWVDPPEESP
ncbi:MAG: hypothetical protein E4H09_04440 [Spirochaetales bacterium]|nr:MAG: hypothetical protein E4H09_04440 [Spirochaetales bacterium]